MVSSRMASANATMIEVRINISEAKALTEQDVITVVDAW